MTPTLSIQDFSPHTQAMAAMLRRLAEIESPSTDKSAVDKMGAAVAAELLGLGATVQVHPQSQAGNHLVGRWGEGEGGLLFMCHMDTVFDTGTLASFPLIEQDGRLHGPGVFDMKGGIVVLLWALRLLRDGGLLPARPLTALFTSDEETGSDTSRPLIESLARRAAAVFCLEPALPAGELKTARKGTGDMQIITRGRAAHAGTDHDKGRNAIEELAHHILSVQSLTDYAAGTTTNVGIIRGGTRTNVVPDEAIAEVDFRVNLPAEAERLKQWAAARQPVIDGAAVSVSFSVNRPPMPRNEGMVAAFQKARAIAAPLGLDLAEGSTGGGSDANFVAPLGTPVLDGLGVRGNGAHSEREFMLIDSLPERAALLAALITNW